MEAGVHYGGLSIGRCGIYNTRVTLEGACSSDSSCVGYSTNKNVNTGAAAENGFYPWCLKRTEDKTATVDQNHNYYRKILKGIKS